jgi:hypothetical protein
VDVTGHAVKDVAADLCLGLFRQRWRRHDRTPCFWSSHSPSPYLDAGAVDEQMQRLVALNPFQ